MFLILLNYIQSTEEIEKHLVEHRKFLDKYYEKGFFIMSGPQVPRTGGVILANVKDQATLQKILGEDPFYQNKIAEYKIIEFTPNKYKFENFFTANE